MSITEANEHKLDLAADHGLQAKFDYRGEGDTHAKERRVLVEEFYEGPSGPIVGGESYTADGYPEGYRQFRLDRISGKVAIR